jgi:hypothetical protein
MKRKERETRRNLRQGSTPNQSLELTASSVRSCVAPAFSRSSGSALI